LGAGPSDERVPGGRGGGGTPNWSRNALTRSGLTAAGDSCNSDPSLLTNGAALTLGVAADADTFFLFRDGGTKAVASFLRSRNSGSAEIVAEALERGSGAEVDPGVVEGLGGNDGCPKMGRVWYFWGGIYARGFCARYGEKPGGGAAGCIVLAGGGNDVNVLKFP